MKIEMPTAAISGKFRMVVSKDAEMRDVTHDTGEFNNLITDVGMNRIGQLNVTGFQNLCGRFVVGSGSATPAFTDTSLQTPVAFAANNPAIVSQSSSYDRGYYEIVVSHQFGQGGAAGNLSEIGIQHTSTSGPLWSRALILDGSGNPTTITVLPDDFLTCYYTLRINIPKTDSVFSINVVKDGVPTPTTVTIRPLYTESVATNSGWTLKSGDIQGSYAFNQSAFYTGGLAVATAMVPLGSIVGTPATSQWTQLPYVTNSFEKYMSITHAIGNSNGAALRSAIINPLMGRWQAEFDPPFSKDNTQSMNVTFGYSWARA